MRKNFQNKNMPRNLEKRKIKDKVSNEGECNEYLQCGVSPTYVEVSCSSLHPVDRQIESCDYHSTNRLALTWNRSRFQIFSITPSKFGTDNLYIILLESIGQLCFSECLNSDH